MSGYLGPQPVPQATQHRQTVTATAGLTSITTSGYQPGYVDVYMNGVKLVDGTDYTATDGASITLASAANANDIIEIIANVPFQLVGMTFTGTTTTQDLVATSSFKAPVWTTAGRPASPAVGMVGYNTTLGAIESWNGTSWQTGGGLVMQSVQTASFTAAAGNSYPINTTSGAVTATLPASATAGQQVNFFDYAGTAATNNITINPNGGNINGLTTSAVLSVGRGSVTLIYVDSTQGWVDISIGNNAYIRQNYSFSYLVVAGGGGGGYNASGGGGAGGLLSGSLSSVSPGTVYTVTVGAGGTGGGASVNDGTNGSNSVLSVAAVTAIGGGGAPGDPGTTVENGFSGGSGGGGRGTGSSGGSGTSGQGYAGGAGNGGTPFSGGGGGGAGGIGVNATGSGAGTGGIGVSSSITGTATYYAGGGGGGSYQGTQGSGGLGGGGAASVNATANTGGGGGGGANGGSGVVILSVPTASYSGITTGSPTVTTSGSNTVIKFTASGSYTA